MKQADFNGEELEALVEQLVEDDLIEGMVNVK
jgi:hypothetical protein